jgi:hypothetical protein
MAAAADAVAAMGAIVQATGDGELTPHEAAELAKLVASFSQAIAATELEQRLQTVEHRLAVLAPRSS